MPRSLLVIDNHQASNGNGWLRSVDITTRNYAVTTLSGSSEDFCPNNSTLRNPLMLDVLQGTPLVMVVDGRCRQVYTYNMDTRGFLITAGKASASGTSDNGGACHGIDPALLGTIRYGIWNTDGDMFILLTSIRRVMRITRPNTPECMVVPLNTDHDIWSGPDSSSMYGMALLAPNRILVAASREVIVYDAVAKSKSRILGQYSVYTQSGWREGLSCHAQLGDPSGLLLHTPGVHGADSALYFADRGSLGSLPSVWRMSMPCPSDRYWSGDGECTLALPGRVCTPCSEDTSSCPSANLTEVDPPLPPSLPLSFLVS